MDVFLVVGGGVYGGGREGNSGIRAPPLSPHVQMNNGGQQKTCCDSYRWEMQAICVEAAFFLSALFARFPYTPSTPPLLLPHGLLLHSHRPAGNRHSVLSR